MLDNLPAEALSVSSWQDDLQYGDILLFRFPTAEDGAQSPSKIRPCLVLDVEEFLGDKFLWLAYGTTASTKANKGYEIRVADPAAIASCSLGAPLVSWVAVAFSLLPHTPDSRSRRGMRRPASVASAALNWGGSTVSARDFTQKPTWPPSGASRGAPAVASPLSGAATSSSKRARVRAGASGSSRRYREASNELRADD